MWESRELGDVDFRIKCNGCVWKCHKAILAANSEYFAELFSAPQPRVCDMLFSHKEGADKYRVLTSP
jgi:hypothetical protein